MMDKKEECLFSVVTVCLNAIDTIRMTIESVIKQKNASFEYIIVDGMSTDGTFDIISQYSNNTNIKCIREYDCGIYDAMNKAVKVACGKYIYFLGSGDYLYNEDVLFNLSQLLEKGNVDVLCGKIEHTFKNETVIVNYYKKRTLSKVSRAAGLSTCHQAFLVMTKHMKNYNFDTRYKYGADQDLLAYCLKQKRVKYKYIDMIICKVDPYGFTCNVPKSIVRQELDSINYNHNRFWYYVLFFPKYIVRLGEKILERDN